MCTFTRNVVCGEQNEVRQNGKAGVALLIELIMLLIELLIHDIQLRYIRYTNLIKKIANRLQIRPIYYQVYERSVAHRSCIDINYEDIPKYHLQVNGIVRFLSHSILQSVKNLSGKCSIS